MPLVKKARGLQRFMLDCGFWRSPKWAGATLAEIGLQTAAVSYCNEHATDGQLPGPAEELAAVLGLRHRDVAKTVPRLTARGTWALADHGYEIVGFLGHNPSREEVQLYRERRAAAGIKGNHDRWHGDKADPDCPLCAHRGPDRSTDRKSDRKSDATTDSQCMDAEQAEDAVPPSPPHVNGREPDGGGRSPTVLEALERIANDELRLSEQQGGVHSPERLRVAKFASAEARYGKHADELVEADPALTPSELVGVLRNATLANAYHSRRAAEAEAAGF